MADTRNLLANESGRPGSLRSIAGRSIEDAAKAADKLEKQGKIKEADRVRAAALDGAAAMEIYYVDHVTKRR